MDIFIYDWVTKNIDNKTEICLYGIDKEKNSCCIRVINYKHTIYIRFFDEKFVVEKFNFIKKKFSELFSNENVIEEDITFVKYNLHNKSYNFIKILINTKKNINEYNKKFTDETMLEHFGCKFTFCNLHPNIIKNFRKEKSLKPVGWFSINNYIIINDKKISKCNYEYLIDKNKIKNSSNTDIPNIKILAWDIEANCENINKNPGLSKLDCVFQISCIFFSNFEIKKVLLSLGKCKQFSNDVNILLYCNEKELILGFKDLIQTQQPNIITGWNIFGFDIPFLINRANYYSICDEFLTFGFTNEIGNIICKNPKSKYINVDGILTIDLYTEFKKNYSLESYSLANVSKKFLNSKKDDITFQDIKRGYNVFLNNGETLEDEFTLIGKYCVQDSQLVVDLFLNINFLKTIFNKSIKNNIDIKNMIF